MKKLKSILLAVTFMVSAGAQSVDYQYTKCVIYVFVMQCEKVQRYTPSQEELDREKRVVEGLFETISDISDPFD